MLASSPAAYILRGADEFIIDEKVMGITPIKHPNNFSGKLHFPLFMYLF